MQLGFKISDRKIGNFKLDATTAEDHSAELKITDNPVESGAVISDHAVVEPKKITITGVIVGYEPVLQILSTPPKELVLDAGKRLDGIILGRNPSLPELRERAENLAKDFKKNFTETIEDPTSFISRFTQPVLGTNNDRIAKYHQMILELQRRAIPLEVYTGTVVYKNMLIQSVTLTQEQDGVGKFVITLRQVVLVDTLKVNLKTTPKGRVRGGRNKATSTKSEVTVQPKPVPNKSGLKKITQRLMGGG